MALMLDTIRFIPCVHRRVTFAEQVRRAALEWQPDILAVELPNTLRQPITDGVKRLPVVTAVCWEEDEQPGEMSYLPIDPCDGLIEAVRLGVDHELPMAFIDLDLPGLQDRHQYVPDDLIVDRAGLDAFIETVGPHLQSSPEDAATLARERHMAARLRALSVEGKKVLCVLGIAHYAGVRRLLEEESQPTVSTLELHGAGIQVVTDRPDAHLAAIHPDSLAEILGEVPYLAYLYEQQREELELVGEAAFDKLGAIQEIYKQAEKIYEKTYRDTINMTQRRALLQYTRNLAMVEGRLRPDLYQLVMAARGIVDGDYGFEVHELASSYPSQPKPAPPDSPFDETSVSEGETPLPWLRVRQGRGMIQGRDERFRMRSRWASPPMESIRLRFRRRPPKRLMKLWKEQWDRNFHLGICSWPPEDEIQERFMDYVRKRAIQAISEDQKHVEPFTTSLLDGLDIRETMRNWHQDQKLYVQSQPQPRGRVGAVVLIFQDEPLTLSDSWRTTLYAEHQNESDISFYARPLGENVVGPRICRTEFGGILSIYPAWGVPDIWRFEMGPEFKHASDALLAAGILFSPERYIAYVAARPPRPLLKQLAINYQKYIIYLPLHTFSRQQLRKVRRFHILDGHDVRRWAADYIFDD